MFYGQTALLAGEVSLFDPPRARWMRGDFFHKETHEVGKGYAESDGCFHTLSRVALNPNK